MTLEQKLSDYQIVLASQSPRRQQLFKILGIPYRIFVKTVEEQYPEDIPVNGVASYLASLKAHAYKQNLKDNWIVVTADTVVIHQDVILGKPQDRQDAVEMLQKLSGNVHSVITGVCLLSVQKQDVFSSETKVWFRQMTDEEIEYYVDKYEPFDKAGAYGIQEWIGAVGIEKIEGSYYNVMGLPVHQLYLHLQEFV